MFSEFNLKAVCLKNRIGVSPMCQYSAMDGVPNEWHRVHLGALAMGGAALVIAEASAVSPEGRITPGDTGLWNDAQAEAFEPIARYIESHGAVPGIQIAHAGRKASANLPWEGDDHSRPTTRRHGADRAVGSAFGANLPRVPRAMTREDIRAGPRRTSLPPPGERALGAGFKWLELHFAHGYLGQSFFSPLANSGPTNTAAASETAPAFCWKRWRPFARCGRNICR